MGEKKSEGQLSLISPFTKNGKTLPGSFLGISTLCAELYVVLALMVGLLLGLNRHFSCFLSFSKQVANILERKDGIFPPTTTTISPMHIFLICLRLNSGFH